MNPIGEPGQIIADLRRLLDAIESDLKRAVAVSDWSTPAAALAVSDAEIKLARCRMTARDLCRAVGLEQGRQQQTKIRSKSGKSRFNEGPGGMVARLTYRCPITGRLLPVPSCTPNDRKVTDVKESTT
jgi:hypothetical protein